jgi:dTDP-4-dehydrorhamnose reductase
VRILITGAKGMLGATLVEQWQSTYDVCATDIKNFPENPARKFFEFDLSSDCYTELLEWAMPDVIVHCGAITNMDYCEKYPNQAMAVNAASVRKLLEIQTQSRLIFISSDAVFGDGFHMASEDLDARPETIYGKSKKVGEDMLREAPGLNLAVRTTIVGKNSNPAAKGFVEWIVESVREDREITLFADVFFTPITIWDFADELEWIIRSTISGVVHVASSDPVSKYEFGVGICSQLGLDIDLIRAGSIDEFKFRAKRSKDQTLDSTYYKRLTGREMPSISDTIVNIARHFESLTNA